MRTSQSHRSGQSINFAGIDVISGTPPNDIGLDIRSFDCFPKASGGRTDTNLGEEILKVVSEKGEGDAQQLIGSD